MDEGRKNELEQYANDIVDEMIKVYNRDKDDEDCIVEGFYGDKSISVYYGNVLNINPSGKYYTCWTTNQTDEDVDEDTLVWDIIEKKLSMLGIWTEAGEGDALDIYICGGIEEVSSDSGDVYE